MRTVQRFISGWLLRAADEGNGNGNGGSTGGGTSGTSGGTGGGPPPNGE